jgi:hypothetical protein
VALATAATGLSLSLCRRSVLLFILLSRRSALLLLGRRLSLLDLRRYRPRFRLCLSRGRLSALFVLRLPHHLRRTRLRTCFNAWLHRSCPTRLRLSTLRPDDLRLTRRRLAHTRALRLLCSTTLVSLLLRLCLLFLLLHLLQLSLSLAVSPRCVSRNLLLSSRIHSGNIRSSRRLSRSI